MIANELRIKFLKFFEDRGHKIVSSSSLVSNDDSSVLLTTAGMQQFKPYYLGKESPYGLNATSCQKCFRTSDIDSVGDESHLTFFEMLGNFSFGGYFKKEAIKYAHEFITKELDLKIDYVSVFGGDKENNLPPDEESEKIWKEIDSGIEVKRFGRKDNFWGPTGNEGPCGPTTEIYIDGVEVWNIVFNQYYQHPDKTLKPLEQKGVDTGMGLERLAMAEQNVPNVFETDLFKSLIETDRILLDHGRAISFLISDGVIPSNKEQGYILRRLMRRVIAIKKTDTVKIENLLKQVVKEYKDFYPELKEDLILSVFREENSKFQKAIQQGLRELDKLEKLDAVSAFKLFESYGLTFDIIKDYAGAKAKNLNQEDFDIEFKKHQELSRTASAGMFKGGLADASEATIKYHTAAHLMLAALRQVLNGQITQRGSNITPERLRFDFSYDKKMTPEEIKQVEILVNEKIKKDLPVKMEEMSLKEAREAEATGIFESKYGERVKVYFIGEFSKEICGGPHVEHTGVLGKFKIIKEESSSAGIRRIRAILE